MVECKFIFRLLSHPYLHMVSHIHFLLFMKVYQTPCNQCLFSPSRIVSDERAAEIIQTCLREDQFFICHKATEIGAHICCRNFFDRYQKAILPLRVAVMLNTVEFVPQNQGKWEIQSQEQSGTYRFEGGCFVTKAVKEAVPETDLENMISQIRQRVAENDGADYLQVFVHSESGQKIFVIDNLSSEMLKGDGYTETQKQEYNYFTIMFAEEY